MKIMIQVIKEKNIKYLKQFHDIMKKISMKEGKK